MKKNNRIRLLSMPSDGAGVGAFRNIWPAQEIQKSFSNELYVEIQMDFITDINYYKQFDIIHFHRQFGPYEQMHALCQELRNHGVIIIMDLDDYWSPSKSHPMYLAAIKDKLPEKITGAFKSVDYVTTTTNIFANHIKKHNPNVHVIPNALDMNHKMWKGTDAKQNDKVRISFIGGSSHMADLELVRASMNMLHNDTSLAGKYQIVMCGYDVRGFMTEVGPNGEHINTRKIDPSETIWNKFEEIFTDNYNPRIVSEDYKKYLLKYSQQEYPKNIHDENYVRRWTLPLTRYGEHYDYCDVCIAPLVEHTFNEVKCIVGDSLISTDNGVFYIKDLVKNKIENYTEVDGYGNKIVNHYHYENVETIRITTYNGYEIEGTPHHKLLINNQWVELENLKEGDVIELTKPVFLQQEYQFMSFPMLLTKNMTDEKIENCDESMLPKIQVNERWGRFFGYMLGDGNYNGKSQVRISCDKRHTDIVDDVVSLMRSIGLNPSINVKKPDKRCKNILSKEGHGVDISSTCITFLKLAKKYNLCGSHGKTFRVPDLILQSPKSVIKEFLRGLFEADGTINASDVSLCSKDLKLIQQVQYLLLGFNITSHIQYSYNKTYRRNYYNLHLKRDGSDIFYKEINFISKNKIERLESIVNKSHSNAFKKQAFSDTISKISKHKNDVYDIEVVDVHMYNANGIINHNSELKIIESGLKKKALIMQDFGIYHELITNGENGILVATKNNVRGWYEAMKKIILNKDYRESLANNLYNLVKDDYTLENVTKNRVEFYKKVYNQKQRVSSEDLTVTQA